MKKILIFRSGAIGDVLMTTPLVRAIRKKFPKAHITYLTGEWSLDAIKANTQIDEVLTYDDKIIFKRNVFGLFKLIKDIKKKKFDIAFILDKSKWFGFIIKLTGINERIGFDRYGEGKYNTKNVRFEGKKHEIEYYLDLAKTVVGPITDKQIEFHISKSDQKFATDFFQKNNIKKAIGLAPGGASNPGQVLVSKRWPVEYFLQTVNELGKSTQIILLGGKEDIKISSKITNKANTKVIDTTGKLSLSKSASLIKKCACLISNDSVLAHVAVAVGTPTITIFGPTDPKRFGYNDRNNKAIISNSASPSYDVYGNFDKKQADDSIRKVKPDRVIGAAKELIKLKTKK